MTTELQQGIQANTAAESFQASQPTVIQPDQGSTVPTFYQSQDLIDAQKYQDGIEPPSTGEIHKQMWVGSIMMGLMAGLASGNAAAAIVGGMWGAIGIHDYGNTLQQRAEYVPRLKKDGYTMPAILKWYEDGDMAELDKERDYQLRKQEHADTVQHQADELDQRRADSAQRHDEFVTGQGNANARFYAGQRMADARQARMIEAQAGNQSRADERLEKQQQQQLDTELRKTIDAPKQKQFFMRTAEGAMGDLERYRKEGNTAGMAEAYHNVRNNLARASLGGNATLNDHDIESATGLPQWSSQKANELGILTEGRPSDEWMTATKSQIQDDIKNERATITQQGQQAYDSLVAAGTPPEVANARVNKAMIGTGVSPQDWSKPQTEAEPEEPKQPTQGQFDSLMDKYGYAGK